MFMQLQGALFESREIFAECRSGDFDALGEPIRSFDL